MKVGNSRMLNWVSPYKQAFQPQKVFDCAHS
jgi:hypothetical protein